jgi:hypothetical protein
MTESTGSMQTIDSIFETHQTTEKHSIPSKRRIGDKQKSIRLGIITRKVPDIEQ